MRNPFHMKPKKQKGREKVIIRRKRRKEEDKDEDDDFYDDFYNHNDLGNLTYLPVYAAGNMEDKNISKKRFLQTFDILSIILRQPKHKKKRQENDLDL